MDIGMNDDVLGGVSTDDNVAKSMFDGNAFACLNSHRLIEWAAIFGAVKNAAAAKGGGRSYCYPQDDINWFGQWLVTPSRFVASRGIDRPV